MTSGGLRLVIYTERLLVAASASAKRFSRLVFKIKDRLRELVFIHYEHLRFVKCIIDYCVI